MRVEITTKWASVRGDTRLCHPHGCFAAQPRSLGPRIAKSSIATLGAIRPAAVRPLPTWSNRSLLGNNGVGASRCYRFGTPKPAGQPKSELVQAQASSQLSSPPSVDAGLPSTADNPIIAASRAKDQLLAQKEPPSQHDVLTALMLCNKAAILAINNNSSSTIQSSTKVTESPTAASSLLSLDRSPAKSKKHLADQPVQASPPADLIDRTSQVAFEIVSHPTVVITPEVLEAYVIVQSRLGRVETLPHVLDLYASKPKPKRESDGITYVPRNANEAANAVDPKIAEKALDAAIEAKNLDAAIGIIESTYATKAFLRQKVLRKAVLPAATAATAPFAVYLLASNLANFQSSVDHKTATAAATIGLLAYVGFTGSMGLLATLTQNDHMVRITWAPGISLRERWLHEEQRAALDKVATSFGFSQAHRHGEEEGAEFEALRRFVLTRGMVLDRVELMEGMT